MTDRILSSTAQRAYWLGRYLERAGNTARLVSVNANLLIDLPVRLPLGWLPLVDILALEESFNELFPDSEKSAAKSLDANEKDVVRFLLSDQRHPNSMLSSLNFARHNARALRGTLPRAAYEHINDAFLYSKEIFQEPLSRTRRTNGLEHILERLQQIDGFLSSTMMHNAPWHFIRMGNFIERADMTTRLIDLRTTDLLPTDSALEPFDDIQWRSVMKSLDAMQGYAVTVQNPVNQEDVLPFLLQHPDLPRSLYRCVTGVRNALRSLPKNNSPLEFANAMRRQLQRARVKRLQGPALNRYIDARQKQLISLHSKIADTYFSNV